MIDQEVLLFAIAGIGTLSAGILLKGLDMKVRFVLMIIGYAILWAGLISAHLVLPFLDKSYNIHPLMAATIYYGLSYLGSLVFSIALTGSEKAGKGLRISIALFLIYLLFDWYEPPAVVQPTDPFVNHALGWRASLDYAIGFTVFPLFRDWSTVYYFVNIMVPSILAVAITAVVSPKVFSKFLEKALGGR